MFGSIEVHTNFAPELGTVAGRARYGVRALMTRAAFAYVACGLDPHAVDFRRRMGLGPPVVREVADIYGALVNGHADHMRRFVAQGGALRTFWYGLEEDDLLETLGLARPTTPTMMEWSNCKWIFREVAEAVGIRNLVPLNRRCYTADEVRTAVSELLAIVAASDQTQNPYAPDAVILKVTNLFSGEGMLFIHSPEEAEAFITRWVNGHRKIIVELAWTKHISASATWRVTDKGVDLDGLSTQLISHGLVYEGSVVATNDRDLPGLSTGDIAQIRTKSRHFAEFVQRLGFRGSYCVDFIGVGPDQQRLWLATEPNAFRPVASWYARELLRQLNARARRPGVMIMAHAYPLPGAATSFVEVKRSLRDLMLDGVWGVYPTMTELLPQKLVLCAHAPTYAQAATLVHKAKRQLGAV